MGAKCSGLLIVLRVYSFAVGEAVVTLLAVSGLTCMSLLPIGTNKCVRFVVCRPLFSYMRKLNGMVARVSSGLQKPTAK